MTELDEFPRDRAGVGYALDHLEDRLDTIQHLATRGSGCSMPVSHLEAGDTCHRGLGASL